MAEVILMPRLTDTMMEGVIAEWHKKVGDMVKKGDVLAEIETDKAIMELDSYKDGTLLHQGATKGEKIQVNDLLAIIGQQGEDISQHLKKEEGEGAEGKSNSPVTAGQPDLTTPVTKESSPIPKAEGDIPPQTGDSKPKLQNNATSQMDISKLEEVVLMPRLSDTMTEGVVASWHKKVGDDVKKGDVLADIETDKATMELESYKNGKLLHQGAKSGEKIAVNELLCIIGEEGKVDVQGIIASAEKNKQSATGNKQVASGNEQQAVSNKQQGSGNEQSKTINQKPQTETDGRIKASPLAKRLAKEKGIDLLQVHGSGDNGRITKTDIDSFKPEADKGQETRNKGEKGQQAIGNKQQLGEEGYIDIPVSQMRKVIAKRLAESKFGAPHFYLTMEITMDKAMEARTQMNEVSDVKISINDMVIKAVAMALRKHPAVNASWKDDFIRQNQHIHIGVAVAIEDGLIVPVVRFADQKTLSQIGSEVKELADKAKGKKLQPPEFTGNTFTISNLGMMGIDEFTAIINPPDSAIMAVGRIKEIVTRKGEGFGFSNVMKVTLSCDHRSVDGAVGAAFLQTFKKYLENPVTMLV
jgi:pyruvate dehydrogenase E2 component (dihydrolipoamide acetyltransferase)